MIIHVQYDMYECVLSITFYSCTIASSAAATAGGEKAAAAAALHKQRVIGKFAENEFAKLERLVELHEKYSARVRQVDARLAAERRARKARRGDDDEEMETEADEEREYLERTDAGLSSLQLVDYLLVELASTTVPEVLRYLNFLRHCYYCFSLAVYLFLVYKPFF